MHHVLTGEQLTSWAACLHAALVGCTTSFPHHKGAAPHEPACSPAIASGHKTRGTIKTHHKLISALAGHAHEWHTSSSTRVQRAVTLWSRYFKHISARHVMRRSAISKAIIRHIKELMEDTCACRTIGSLPFFADVGDICPLLVLSETCTLGVK